MRDNSQRKFASIEDNPPHLRKVTMEGIFHLIIVYTVWSSTYMAIRIAVRDGSGFPPFEMAGTRCIIGGIILLVIAFIAGKRIKISFDEAKIFFISGILLWVTGNGFVTFGEKKAFSAYAALIVGTTPLWTGLIEAFILRKRPSLIFIFSLLLGFCGIIALNVPSFLKGSASETELLYVIILLLAPIGWGLGSIYLQYKHAPAPIIVSAAYQQIFGGIGLMAAALLCGEGLPSPSKEAWMAWTYLLIFGSVISFSSYTLILKILPMSIVTTYAYVNPAIAVALGYFFLSEPITIWTIIGTALIFAGVWGVFHEKLSGTNAFES